MLNATRPNLKKGKECMWFENLKDIGCNHDREKSMYLSQCPKICDCAKLAKCAYG